jgi:hypothetical protein
MPEDRASRRPCKTFKPELGAPDACAVTGGAERRRAERLHLAGVGIEIGNLCGVGRIHDISSTGARIEDSGLNPPLGALARLLFVLSSDEPAFEMAASVVRGTQTGGFAVEFLKPDPRLERLVDEQIRRAKASGLHPP